MKNDNWIIKIDRGFTSYNYGGNSANVVVYRDNKKIAVWIIEAKKDDDFYREYYPGETSVAQVKVYAQKLLNRISG